MDTNGVIADSDIFQISFGWTNGEMKCNVISIFLFVLKLLAPRFSSYLVQKK